MIETHSDQIEFPSINQYRSGAVTYEVAAFFCIDGQSLKDKVHKLLTESIRKNSICTFADCQKNVVE